MITRMHAPSCKGCRRSPGLYAALQGQTPGQGSDVVAVDTGAGTILEMVYKSRKLCRYDNVGGQETR